jgi:tetratricopeptide (TPR) repeat protein
MIHRIKTLLFTLIFFTITACNMSGVKDEEIDDEKSNIDYIQLKKETDEAYFNDDLVASEKGYEILVREAPIGAENWFRLGNIYVRTDRPAAAINLYREALVRDPNYSKAWYNLSIVQLKQTAYSLTEMLHYTSNDDPLYNKAKIMLDEIQNIIK